LHPDTFNFIKSFDPMIIVVFGGLGSVSGTVVAAFTWALVLEGFLRIFLPNGFETWRFVVYPLLLLLMMLLRPAGLFGKFEFPFLRQVFPQPALEPQPANQQQDEGLMASTQESGTGITTGSEPQHLEGK
jgi:branched-chain amino acid transport system permease protein